MPIFETSATQSATPLSEKVLESDSRWNIDKVLSGLHASVRNTRGYFVPLGGVYAKSFVCDAPRWELEVRTSTSAQPCVQDDAGIGPGSDLLWSGWLFVLNFYVIVNLLKWLQDGIMHSGKTASKHTYTSLFSQLNFTCLLTLSVGASTCSPSSPTITLSPPMSSCGGDFTEGLWPCLIWVSENGREIFIPARLMFYSSV